MTTPEQQRAFFETFGFLVLRGALLPDLEWIEGEFERVFEDWGVVHDGTQRSALVPFIDSRERLCTLLDHPVIQSVLDVTLGADANYIGSDGNYYTGDTGWHADGKHKRGRFLKIAIYLDEVNADTGALRVIPGSHRLDALDWAARLAAHSDDLWGVAGPDVPAISLDSSPGDIVVFNHNLMHSSWGGSARRRMFTMNLCAHCETAAEVAEMRDYMALVARMFWLERLHSNVMRSTASPARMRHLSQVIENEDQMPGLVADARKQAAEPAGVRRPAGII